MSVALSVSPPVVVPGGKAGDRRTMASLEVLCAAYELTREQEADLLRLVGDLAASERAAAGKGGPGVGHEEGKGHREPLVVWLPRLASLVQSLAVKAQEAAEGSSTLAVGAEAAAVPHKAVPRAGEGEKAALSAQSPGMLISGPAETLGVPRPPSPPAPPSDKPPAMAVGRRVTAAGSSPGVEERKEAAGGRRRFALTARDLRRGVLAAGRRGGLSWTEVTQNRDLVASVVAFLVPTAAGGERQQQQPARQVIRRLGQLGLVCRRWREVCAWDGWWEVAAGQVLPLPAWGDGEAGSKGRARVLGAGRQLLAERRVWVGRQWVAGLSMQFEVFDRADGLPMLTVRGPLGFDVFEGNGCSVLCVPLGPRDELVGPSFTAISRDRRLRSIREFFSRSHEKAVRASVCVRVSVRDDATGRVGVLWEEGKTVRRQVCEPSEYWLPFLTPGSLWVGLVGSQPLACPSYQGPPLTGRVSFYACPEPDQPDHLPEAHRAYRLAGGDVDRFHEHCSFVRLFFDTTDERSIAQLVRALLVGK